jgi:hypothetical protein
MINQMITKQNRYFKVTQKKKSTDINVLLER